MRARRFGAAAAGGIASGVAVGMWPMLLEGGGYLGYGFVLAMVSVFSTFGAAAAAITVGLGGGRVRAALSGALPGAALGIWYVVDGSAVDTIPDLVLGAVWMAAITTASGAVFGLIARRT